MSASSLIELFAENLKRDLQESLKNKLQAKSKNGYSGDSRLGASIRVSYLDSAGEIFGFELYLSDYFYWVNKGRASGKGISKEGQENLIRWIRSRGLQPTVKAIKTIKNKQIRKAVKQLSTEKQIKSMVFAISKKIKDKGYDANYFFDEVINDGRIERLTTRFKEQYKQDLQLQINDMTKK